ncbi:MAG TPA: winged helix-turn-helix transcriptional regulator [Steroidobacteraceae bacterium]
MWDETQLQETGDPGIVLSVLTSIERDSSITQRKLANELGIALGLANAYLRRCVRKGLIKMSQVPLNRYAYYLTPQGFTEKSRLTAEYLAVSLDFFRRSRSDCVALFRQCEALGWRKVALYGAGDLAEIAILSASDTAVEVICVIDSRVAGRRCGGLPVVQDLAAALTCGNPGGLDGIILTDTQSPQASFENLSSLAEQSGLPRHSVLAPSVLRISPVTAAIRGEPVL